MIASGFAIGIGAAGAFLITGDRAGAERTVSLTSARLTVVDTTTTSTTTTTTTTTTTPARLDVGDIDFGNFTHEVSCFGPPPQRIELHGGSWVDGASSWFVDLGRVVLADVTGDGERDAVVELMCSAGASTWPDDVLVYEGGANRIPSRVGQALPGTVRSAQSGRLDLEEPWYAADDANCCPSGWQVTSYAYRNGAWQAVDHEVVLDQSDYGD